LATASVTKKDEPTIVAHNFDESNLMLRRLGHLAQISLNEGEPVKDEIIMHILCEKIRSLNSELSWIVDGFPYTYEQAKLFEKALNGYEEDNPTPSKLKRESILAPNPNPPPPKPKHISSIDIVIYLDVTDELAIKRSAGRYGN
jgi:hypothetical protein